MSIELLALATASLLGLGMLETVTHRRNLYAIPTRIHVAGTRGKSSVTRLLAAALREAGVPTAAKTTGTLARMILPDAREVPIFRPRGANIIEQLRVVAAARALGVQALVLECMALQPELHWLSENMMVRATHGVITNVRADHLDVMGPTEKDVGRCLAGMIPVRGVLFTAERRNLDVLAAAAADRGTELVTVSDDDLAAVTHAELARFTHVEHRDNIALALKVLDSLGVDRAVALDGMAAATPDPGAQTEHMIDFFGRWITFVNGFAANDPESTRQLYESAVARHRDVDKVVAVFNLRADRADRTRQLAREATFWHGADHVVLMGSGAYHFAREADRTGGNYVYADHDTIAETFESIIELCGKRTLIVGMANIGEQGLALTRLFRNRRALSPGGEENG